MKTNYLFLTAVLSVLAMSSCQKDNLIDNHLKAPTEHSIYFLSQDNQSFEMMSISSINQNLKLDQIIRPRGYNASAHGRYTATEFGYSLNFSAMQKPNGANGHIKLDGSGVLLNAKIDVDCITVVGNFAYFGGVITDVEFSEPSPIGVGSQAYFAVVDNGEGTNADPDQFGSRVIFLPPGLLVTEALSQEMIDAFGIETWCDLWPLRYADDEEFPEFNFFDGGDPTNIQVK